MARWTQPAPEVKATWEQVLRWRAERHLLGADRAADPVAVARRLCGIHNQVAASTVTATALRIRSARDVATALDHSLTRDRSLVKTWAARGTLHVLPAGDMPAWVAAMSTRTRETTGSWLKYHQVTAADMTALHEALPEVLGRRPLTREELTDTVVRATGRDRLREALSQGWGAVLKPAAFRGLICFGPPRGRNVTFVSPRDWLPGPWPEVSTEDGIDAVLRDYLAAYGPADPAEFSRWFDLRPPLAKAAFARLGDELALVDVDGAVGALPRALREGLLDPPRDRLVRLLPAFDPYTVGSLRQLTRVAPGLDRSAVSRPQGWISPVLLVDGAIAGTWRSATRDGVLTVTLSPAETLTRPVRAAVSRAAGEIAAATGATTATVTVT